MMRWTESIEIDRPHAEVRGAVADQHRVMQWSAWPEATGFTCRVDGDGRSPGSEIVFSDASGEEKGRQRILTSSDLLITNRLRNQGPGGRVVEPEVDFRLEPLGEGTTRVHLDFFVDPPVPRLLRPVVGLVLRLRVRPLHRKDLSMLKDLVEADPGTEDS